MTHIIKLPPFGELRVRRNGEFIDLTLTLPLLGSKTIQASLDQAKVLASALQIEIEAA